MKRLKIIHLLLPARLADLCILQTLNTEKHSPRQGSHQSLMLGEAMDFHSFLHIDLSTPIGIGTPGRRHGVQKPAYFHITLASARS